MRVFFIYCSSENQILDQRAFSSALYFPSPKEKFFNCNWSRPSGWCWKGVDAGEAVRSFVSWQTLGFSSPCSRALSYMFCIDTFLWQTDCSFRYRPPTHWCRHAQGERHAPGTEIQGWTPRDAGPVSSHKEVLGAQVWSNLRQNTPLFSGREKGC